MQGFFVSVQFNKTSFDVYVKDHRIQHRKQSSHISLLHGSLSYKRRRVPLSQPHFTYNDFIVGDSLQLGSRLVTAEEVIAFASEFDPQPFHMSEEAGKASILGGLSASGWHTCAMLMRMMADRFISNSDSQGAPGVEYVKWLKPVLAGDTISATTTFKMAPTLPMPSGEIPNNQLAGMFSAIGVIKMPLK